MNLMLFLKNALSDNTKRIQICKGVKIKTLLRNLALIEKTYTQSNTNNYDNFIKDMNNLFVDYKKAIEMIMKILVQQKQLG